MSLKKFPQVTDEICAKIPDHMQGECLECMKKNTHTVKNGITELKIPGNTIFQGDDAPKACVLEVIHASTHDTNAGTGESTTQEEKVAHARKPDPVEQMMRLT